MSHSPRTPDSQTPSLTLRPVVETDLPVFFEQQRDPAATHLIAFITRDPDDRDAFDQHWVRIMANPSCLLRTIALADQVVGNIMSFEDEGQREVGYVLGKSFWGTGIATEALRQFLGIETARPLQARVAKDNLGSVRVLEKCGFVVVGAARQFSQARGSGYTELLLRLAKTAS